MDDCYEPSSLISWMHEEIPFINIGFNNSGGNAEALLDNLDRGIDAYYDYFVRAVVWGVIVTLVGSPLLILTCTWHCCTVWICKRDDDGDVDRYKMARVTCVVLLLLQIILSICIISVGFWAEEQFNDGFKENIDDVQRFIQNVTSISDGESSNNSTLELLTAFETSSHWIFISYFTFLFLPLLSTLLAIAVTILWKHTIIMIITLIVLMITSICLLPIIGVATIFLIIYSDVCIGLQYKQLHDVTNQCIEQLTGYSDTLDNFCNDAYLSSVIMVTASAVLGLICVGLQLSGSCYAGIYAGYKRGTGRIANEENNADHELQNITTPSTENEPSPPVDTNEDDTTALLPAIETGLQSPTATEDVQQFLDNHPANLPPSAPALTNPPPSTSEQPPDPTSTSIQPPATSNISPPSTALQPSPSSNISTPSTSLQPLPSSNISPPPTSPQPPAASNISPPTTSPKPPPAYSTIATTSTSSQPLLTPNISSPPTSPQPPATSNISPSSTSTQPPPAYSTISPPPTSSQPPPAPNISLPPTSPATSNVSPSSTSLQPPPVSTSLQPPTTSNMNPPSTSPPSPSSNISPPSTSLQPTASPAPSLHASNGTAGEYSVIEFGEETETV